MADLLVVVTVVAFFVLCVGLVWGCDRIIGPDDQTDLAADEHESAPETAEPVR